MYSSYKQYTAFPEKSSKGKRSRNFTFYNNLYELVLLNDVVLLSFWLFSFSSIGNMTLGVQVSIKVKQSNNLSEL